MAESHEAPADRILAGDQLEVTDAGGDQILVTALNQSTIRTAPDGIQTVALMVELPGSVTFKVIRDDE